jgi:hypothetical protein
VQIDPDKSKTRPRHHPPLQGLQGWRPVCGVAAAVRLEMGESMDSRIPGAISDHSGRRTFTSYWTVAADGGAVYRLDRWTGAVTVCIPTVSLKSDCNVTVSQRKVTMSTRIAASLLGAALALTVALAPGAEGRPKTMSAAPRPS